MTVVDAPRDDVEFAVPAWGVDVRASAMPALKVVQVRSAGVDWIVDDVPDHITLCSARGTRDAAMAEWIVAALLADAKRLGPFAARRAPGSAVTSSTSRGRRIVVLGHGSSGRAAERLLTPFGVRSSASPGAPATACTRSRSSRRCCPAPTRSSTCCR